MSAVDPYEYDESRRHRSSRHRDRRDDRDPRYIETQETYLRSSVPLAPDPPYVSRHDELIRRPDRHDSDFSIEEIRREFPPPGTYVQQRSMVRDDRYGPPVRSRSAERGYGTYLGDPRDDRRSRRSTTVEEKVVEPRHRSLSRNQKIIAAVSGAALAVGGKELFDRRQAHGGPVSRNALHTAAIGAAGAFAGYEGAELYAKHTGRTREKEKTKTYIAHQGRNGEVAEYYSSDEESIKTKKSRRKSIVEDALGLIGLGAAAKTVGDKSRSRRGSRRVPSPQDLDLKAEASHQKEQPSSNKRRKQLCWQELQKPSESETNQEDGAEPRANAF